MITPSRKPLPRNIFGGIAVALGLLSYVIIPYFSPAESQRGVMWAFGASLAGMISLFISFGYVVSSSAFGILLNGRNVYSLSRLQMVSWTLLVLSTLMAIAAWRWSHGVDALQIGIPNNLLAAMGISFVSAAAAPAVLSLKSQSQPSDDELMAASGRFGSAIASSGKIVGRPPEAKAAISDLVKGDELANAGSIDLSKVQQLIITGMLVVSYYTMLWRYLWATKLTGGVTLPDFSPSLINLLLISHGGYLAYKAVSKPADTAMGLQRPLPPDRNGPTS